MNTYRYNIPGIMDPEEWREFISRWGSGSGKLLAEDAAQDYHDDGGWESCWPITFVVQLMDGTDLGIYDVDREAFPEFYATRVKK